MGELVFVGMKDLRSISIEEEEGSDAEPQSNLGPSELQAPAASQPADLAPEAASASLAVESDPESPPAFKPVPRPRSSKKAPAVQEPGPDAPPPVQQLATPTPVPSTSPSTSPSPSPVSSLPPPVYAAIARSKSTSESLNHESGTAAAKGPLPCIPPPPPLPFKLVSSFGKARTKAFHWDVVSSDKVAPSPEASSSFVRKHLIIICPR